MTGSRLASRRAAAWLIRLGLLGAIALLILVAVTQIVGILTALTFVFAGMFGFLFVPGLSVVGLITLAVAVV